MLIHVPSSWFSLSCDSNLLDHSLAFMLDDVGLDIWSAGPIQLHCKQNSVESGRLSFMSSIDARHVSFAIASGAWHTLLLHYQPIKCLLATVARRQVALASQLACQHPNPSVTESTSDALGTACIYSGG